MGILVFLSIMTAALAVLSSWYRIRRVKEQIAGSLCPMNAGFLRCGRQRRQTVSL